jgi:two-component system, OmpR family, phosphate regulon sensor histidine kinase PhoR
MKRKKPSRFTRFRERQKTRGEQLLAYQEEFYRKRLDNPQDIDSAKFPHTPRKWVIFGILFFWSSMIFCFFLAYGIMSLIDWLWFPQLGYSIGRQFLTVMLMILLFGCGIMLVRLIFDPGRQQINSFMLLMDAMRRMAKGEFNITLDTNPQHMGQFGVLVKSFNEMAMELSQMETMRQEFISNVSHEFQSPLTSIGGFARALQSDDLSPDMRRHYLQIIEMEITRLSKLSDNLLKLTSLESNHHPFEPKVYRLDRQLRRIILSCEPQWQDKRLEMDIEMDEITITADEELLNQVWINLLHNAVKFTPEGGTVRVRLTIDDDRIRTDVSDTGIGVPAHELPHLFERFYKADKARNRAGGGSGLGLSIVHKIVEMHGGDITVSSHPGEGTAFVVTLPTVTSDQSAQPYSITTTYGRAAK